MKRVLRYGMLETNSSMSHSLVIMTEDQHKKWEEEKSYYYNPKWEDYTFERVPEGQRPVKGLFYTQEEVLEFLKLAGYEYDPAEAGEYDEDYEDPIDDFIYDIDYYFKGYDKWHESDWEEYDSYTYTTPGGEHLVIETKCGRDG